jgi:hypothetical protein
MIKRLILACLLFTAPAWAATEYLRPTADANTTVSLAQCANTDGTSSMAAVYTGKSGIGPTGSSATQTASTLNTSVHTTQRTFSTWQTTTNTYSALTVYVSSKYATTAGSGSGYLYYSTDGGSNWAVISNSTTSQATHSVIITGTALTSLQVITCSLAATSAGTTITTIYDIWTAGTYTTGYIMPRFIRSVFHKQRHKTKRILLARGANVVGPAGQ